MEKPHITKDNVTDAFESQFVKLYGLEYVKGKLYMNRTKDDLVALKADEDFKNMLPDAVSCAVILDGDEPRLLLNYEFRYPTGQYLLSVPAGLIDEADKKADNPVFTTAIRELKEETNIGFSKEDRIEVINPLLFSSPGMTDESNAFVCIVIANPETLSIKSDGAEGTECFNGYVTLTKADAERIIKQGRDDKGIFYSVFTWVALMYFISGMWR